MDNKEKLNILYIVILVIEKNIIEDKIYYNKIENDLKKFINKNINKQLTLSNNEAYIYFKESKEEYMIIYNKLEKLRYKINNDIIQYNKLKKVINYSGYKFKEIEY